MCARIRLGAGRHSPAWRMLHAYAGGPSPVVEARFADSTHVSGGQASGSRDPQRAGQVRVWATVIGSGGVNETRRKASDRQAKWEASAGRTARPTPLGNVSEKKRQPRQKPLVEASCPFSGAVLRLRFRPPQAGRVRVSATEKSDAQPRPVPAHFR